MLQWTWAQALARLLRSVQRLHAGHAHPNAQPAVQPILHSYLICNAAACSTSQSPKDGGNVYDLEIDNLVEGRVVTKIRLVRKWGEIHGICLRGSSVDGTAAA